MELPTHRNRLKISAVQANSAIKEIWVRRGAEYDVCIHRCMVKSKHANGFNHQTRAPNASTNGGDASRVVFFGSIVPWENMQQ